VLTRRAAESTDDLVQLMFNDQRGEIFMCEPLPWCAARVIWRLKLVQHLVVKEVREGSVTNIVEEPRHTQRLYYKTFAGDWIAARAQLLCE